MSSTAKSSCRQSSTSLTEGSPGAAALTVGAGNPALTATSSGRRLKSTSSRAMTAAIPSAPAAPAITGRCTSVRIPTPAASFSTSRRYAASILEIGLGWPLYNIHAPLSACRSQDALVVFPWAVVQPGEDTSLAVFEGDWPVPSLPSDPAVAGERSSTGPTESDVTACVICLFSSCPL